MALLPADQEIWAVDMIATKSRGYDILAVPPEGVPPHMRGNGTPVLLRRASVPLTRTTMAKTDARSAMLAALRRAREIALLPELLRVLPRLLDALPPGPPRDEATRLLALLAEAARAD